ncbi:MAG: hypothetical protein JOY90_31200 [Bradyrhizobium sp.]|uniref:hypothetical protein n=1 Tax=Bradyrhizobium sp. TaxID=376 RepID=UPI001DC1D4CB|nr:hypothetical protein [Bradyrhizobium sp.]MBV9564880.1 hypothetical protein [Bradyrhizobium sp.]
MRGRLWGGAPALAIALGLAFGLTLPRPGLAQGAWDFTKTDQPSPQSQPPKDGEGNTGTADNKDTDAKDAADADAKSADGAEVKSADPDIMKDIDVDKLDWSQLNVDASTLVGTAKSSGKSNTKTQFATGTAAIGGMSWSGSNTANGSSAVSVKQQVTPIWDTRVGADMTVAPQPTTMSELLAEKATNGGSAPQSSGSAWAAVTAPGAGSVWDRTAVEARVTPNQEQSRIGTSLTKSVPLDAQYSLSLQNGYNLIQQGIVPVPGIISHPSRSYDTEQSAKLDMARSGTSLTAGQTLSSSEDRWLRRVGAEQKLYGGISLSGSVGETAQGTTTKSITAGFKRSW